MMEGSGMDGRRVKPREVKEQERFAKALEGWCGGVGGGGGLEIGQRGQGGEKVINEDGAGRWRGKEG